MTLSDHPHYHDEQQHLQRTLATLAQRLDEYQTDVPQASTNAAKRSLNEHNRDEAEQLRTMQGEPYFGRVDLREDEHEVFYVGRHALPKLNIYSWADTLAAQLYYNLRSSHTTGELLLKRTFQFTGRAPHPQLKTIVDDFVHPDLYGVLAQNADRYTDSMLLRLLDENRTGKLHDIIATIQQQQYRIIQSPASEPLVVQGVPGSGKTSVALHRIAYLLYNLRTSRGTEGRAITGSDMLVLAPNPMFLSYIHSVLPALGEQQVVQRTFDEWLMYELGTDIDHEPQESSLEALLNDNLTSAEKAVQYQNAAIKGSLRMARLLDRYVDLLRARLLPTDAPFRFTYSFSARVEASVERTVPQMQALLDRMGDLPLNLVRDEFSAELLRDVQTELLRKLPMDLRTTEEQTRLRNDIERHIAGYLKGWNALNVSVAYRRLLRTPSLLREAGEDILSEQEQELLHLDAPRDRTPFRFSDLAALLYLRLKLDGSTQKHYEHIVVDEAQDITPLHLSILRRYSRQGGMTILGDLSQSIYAHHGVSRWEDLREAVGPLTVEHLRESYRSARAIIGFGNALLGRIGTDESHHAVAINQQGRDVYTVPLQQPEQLVRQIHAHIAEEQQRGRRSIAIVCKTLAGCRTLHDQLQTAGIPAYQFVESRNTTYQGGVTLIPAYLTKGLEFDSVLVADADASTYPADSIHARLLYVVITRASHSLSICWVGQRSPLINQNAERLSLAPVLGGYLQPRPLTIRAYAQEVQANADWCVERLAAKEKLALLRNGTIEYVLIDSLLRPELARQNQDDEAVAALSDVERRRLYELLREVLTAPEHIKLQRRSLIHMGYGLARHHMSLAGLELPPDTATDLDTQAALLVAYRRAMQRDQLIVTAGRWTTRAAVLRSAPAHCKDAAETLLGLFLEHGIVEERPTGMGPLLRVRQEWLAGLVDLSTGTLPTGWDSELLNAIALLPQSLDIAPVVTEQP